MKISAEKYAYALSNTLKDETDESVVKTRVSNFLKMLKKTNSLAVLRDFIPVFQKAWRKTNKIVHVKVIVPRELSQSEEDALKVQLKESLKKEIKLEKEIDTAVIGGLKVVIENEIVVDSTVKNRLIKLKRSIS